MKRTPALVLAAAALIVGAVFVLRPGPKAEAPRRAGRAMEEAPAIEPPPVVREAEPTRPTPTAAPPTVPAPAPAPAPAPSPLQSGVVHGTVRVLGPVPKPRRIRVDADPKCAALHPEPVFSEELVVDEKLGVRWAFVYVKEGPLPRTPPSPVPAQLNQVGCRYEPHALGLQIGQSLVIRNGDPLLHAPHALPLVNPFFAIGQPAFTEKTEWVFNQEEVMFSVRCDIHPWMKAWVGVLPHPWFAVTDAAGKYQLPALGEGSYSIVLWHETYKDVVRGITVKPGETLTLDFLLDVRK